MRKLAILLVVLFVVPVMVAQGTPSNPAPPETTSSGSSEQGSTEQPITVAFGPQEGGGLVVVVKGAEYYVVQSFINQRRDFTATPPRFGYYTPSAYVYLAPEVNWSTQAAATNQYSLSVRPSFQLGFQPVSPPPPESPDSKLWPVTAPFFETYVDVRRQAATKEATDPEAAIVLAQENAQEDIDATFYGIGVGVAVPYLSRIIERQNPTDPGAFPMLRVTYYKSDGESTANSTIASDLKGDQINASLTFSLPLPAVLSVDPRLDFDGSLSRATSEDDREWKNLIKAALLFQIGESDFKPVLSYTSGEKLGFKYDRQLLLGLAFDFAKGFLNRN